MKVLRENIECTGRDKLNWFHADIDYRHIVLGILVFGVTLRLLGLNKGLWIDEYFSLNVISSGDFFQSLRLQNKPPLFYLFHRISSLISMSEPFLRLTSVMFGMGTLVLIIKWIKRYSLPASLLAGLLCATLPIMLRYSQELRGYSVLLFATVLSFFFASRLSHDTDKTFNYIGLSMSLIFATGTHLLGIMLIPAIILFIAFSGTDYRRISFVKFIVTVSAPGIVFLYLYLSFLQHLPDKDSWWMPVISFSSVLATLKEMLGITYVLHPAVIIRRQIPALAVSYQYFIELTVIGICISLVFFGNWRRSLSFFAAAMCYWLLLIIYSLMAIPIFWYRTALPGLIPFIGFMALQLDSIRIKHVKVASIAGVLILCTIFAAGWTARSAWVPYEQWKQISGSLEAKWERDDIVIFYPKSAEGLVKYYFPALPPESAFAVKKGLDIKEVALGIRGRINRSGKKDNGHTIFLIVREDLGIKKDFETYRNLLSYLQSDCGQPTLSKHFGNLSLSKYECQTPK